MAQNENSRPNLLMPRTEAEERLKERIKIGENLLITPIRDSKGLNQAKKEQQIWSDYNSELLRRMVDTDKLYNDYNPPWFGGFGGKPPTLEQQITSWKNDITDKVKRLQSILNRLELIPESPSVQSRQPLTASHNSEFFTIHIHRENLLHRLDKLYDYEEFRELCYALGVDTDNLAGEKKRGQMRGLLLKMERESRLLDMLWKIREQRPQFEWKRLIGSP